MKLVSHYLQEIAGVQIFPIISFVLFFSFFLLVVFLVIKSDKNYMKQMASMPLDNNDSTSLNDNLNSKPE